jgi:hypothetical protein
VLTQSDLAAASTQRVSIGSDGRLGISYGASSSSTSSSSAQDGIMDAEIV